jgi:hypothetical protein
MTDIATIFIVRQFNGRDGASIANSISILGSLSIEVPIV